MNNDLKTKTITVSVEVNKNLWNACLAKALKREEIFLEIWPEIVRQALWNYFQNGKFK